MELYSAQYCTVLDRYCAHITCKRVAFAMCALRFLSLIASFLFSGRRTTQCKSDRRTHRWGTIVPVSRNSCYRTCESCPWIIAAHAFHVSEIVFLTLPMRLVERGNQGWSLRALLLGFSYVPSLLRRQDVRKETRFIKPWPKHCCLQHSPCCNSDKS